MSVARVVALGLCLLAPELGAQLSVTGTMPTLSVTSATAGSEPAPVIGTGSQYRVKVNKNAGPQRLTASISAAMPAGVTLTLEAAPTTGATSLGPVTLSTTARDLVTNITNTAFESQNLTYTFTVTVAAGVLPLSSRTVTLTVTNWP